MKVFFNTKTFDSLIKENNIEVTDIPGEAELLVLGAKKVDFSVFKKLKAVYRFGAGDENVDFGFLEKRSIPVYFPSETAKQILYESTANFTIYAILTLLYDGAFGEVKSWKKYLRGCIGRKIALVVGTGNVGSRVVNKLKNFMRVITYDTLHNKADELEPMLRKADVITIHIPLNNKTKNFFDSKKLSWIKNDAIIINTARGDLFDEDALYKKLKNSNCRAFFDVFWHEPYNGKLKSLGSEKFFMTPHSASNTKEFIQEGIRDILNILKRI